MQYTHTSHKLSKWFLCLSDESSLYTVLFSAVNTSCSLAGWQRLGANPTFDMSQGLKNQVKVKLSIVSCPPVTTVLIKRPDLKFQLGFSVQNGIVSKPNSDLAR